MANDSGVQGLDTPPVRLPPGTGRAESTLQRLSVAGKPLLLLRQRGAFADIAYDHGRLLAGEIEDGVFPEILSAIARGTDLGGAVQDAVATALFRGLSNRVVAGVSDEFRAAIGALADGYRDALPQARFSRQQVIDAVLAIEIGNLVDGLARCMDVPSLPARAGAIGEALVLCALEHPDDSVRAFLAGAPADPARQAVLAGALARMTHPDHRSGFACTGFSVPAGMTADGRHLHARNLDADLYDWNRATTLFLLDETDGHPGWHRYVAFGTAGLIYPGGISGLNEAGIAASLHQLSTTRTRTRFASGQADIAPFVQQRILREAGSLDEAVEIARATQAFAAWVIFCSEARTGRARQIEFNGEAFRVGPVVEGPAGQTNHFRHPDLVEHLFDANDAHFTPTLGKWLETRTRLAMLEGALAGAAAMDTDRAIDLLASGRDWQLIDLARRRGLDEAATGVERSFGRVPRKAYGQLGSIVRGDPARRPGHDEAWMTIGDRLPACQSIFTGWRIDWAGFDLQPVADRPLRRTSQYAETGRAGWESSFETYRAARVAFARPRDAAGALLTHAPDPAQLAQDMARAEALLSLAIEQAASDRIVEVPYHYLRARIRHALGLYDAAKADWDLLRAIAGDGTVAASWPVATPLVQPVLLEVEEALVLALSAVTEDRLQGDWHWEGRTARLQAARALLEGVRARFFPDGAAAHFDLVAWIGRVDALMTRDGGEVALPEPNFVTVE